MKTSKQFLFFIAGVIFGAGVVIINPGLKSFSSSTTKQSFTDGVVTATLDQRLGTLTFSGHGAVDGALLEKLPREQRVFVRTIVFEDGITSVGSHAFYDGQGLINLEKVVFKGDINKIGCFAFENNPNLTTVEFGGRCKVIDFGAFKGCVSLGPDDPTPDDCEVDCAVYRDTCIVREN